MDRVPQPLPDTLDAETSRESRIDAVARELRAALVPVLRAAAGRNPRPMQLAHAIDIDKSLASVLVRAVNAPDDRSLLHFVPSPTGLRILIERTKGIASTRATWRLETATESFRSLLEATPGGRAALDAHISEQSRALGHKRENTSKQAAFKAMSFLVGYYSEAMASSIFLVPSEDGRMVDGIQVIRRLGIRRMRSHMPIPLFHYTRWPHEGEDIPASRLDPIPPDPAGPHPSNLLLPDYSTDPMPAVEVFHEGTTTTVVLPGRPGAEGAMDFAWAFRLRNGGPLDPGAGTHFLHSYFMRMPTRSVVRDVFLAEGIYPGAVPFVSWALPATEQHEHPPVDAGARYYGQVDLDGEFERVDSGPRMLAVPGMPDHDRLTAEVLERAGHAKTRFRGWRCTLNYPVPMLEMLVWLCHPEAGELGRRR
jgi:hypothetical protein